MTITNYNNSAIVVPANLPTSILLKYNTSLIVFENNIFNENYGILSNAIYIFGAQAILINNNSFIKNGIFLQDLFNITLKQNPLFYMAYIQTNYSYSASSFNIYQEVFLLLKFLSN